MNFVNNKLEKLVHLLPMGIDVLEYSANVENQMWVVWFKLLSEER